MNTFTEIYETDIGQMVVIRHMSEDKLDIQIYHINPNGNGVCRESVGSSDCDAGRGAAIDSSPG